MAHRPATSSSSDFKHKWTHDVFLSFRGEDTRYGFTGSLYDALRRKEINTFIDDEKLGRGEEISPALLKAIEESRVSIVVFSENYANSGWCLDELVAIIKCMKSKGQWVHPVFYKVDPSDVRHQTNSVGKALAELQNKSNISVERVKKWKSAMEELAALSGLHLKDGYEYEYIQKIVEDVSRKLDRIFLHIADHPVGIESRVSKVTSLLKTWPNDDAQLVGIYGLGGIGKTTIARAVYNFIANQFVHKCFLANVRESCSNMEGLVKLQRTLLSKILGDKDVDIADDSEGIAIINHRLSNKTVLLVLDDVDDQDQLQKLAGNNKWFGTGSKIIITTRDRGLLAAHGVDSTYPMEELDDKETHELFCWHAFKRSGPNAGYEDITMRAIHQAKNLPLVLKIIGSDLYGRSIDVWKSILDKYEKNPNKKVHQQLKISYDNLEHNYEKQIFLDIACFFKGMSLDTCKEALAASDDCCPGDGIRVLLEKSLIDIKDKVLWMHDIIQDMGREIVRGDTPLKPFERSRLWFHKDVLQVLTENTGTDKIEGIMLKLPKEENLHWSGEAFKKMTNLRILIVENAYFSQGPKHLPNSLQVLDWKSFPSSSFPADFHPTKLVVLNLPESHFQLKKSFNFKKYEYLIFMDFSRCLSLKEVPDISGIPNLVELYFDHCSNLVKVHDSVGRLKLVKLSCKYCHSLNRFPPSLVSTALEYLNLRGCHSLKRFPDILDKMEKVKFIDISGTSIEELPSSCDNLVGIEALHMQHCNRFRSLPNSFLMLPNLKDLDMERCPELPTSFVKFVFDIESHLVSLNVERCDLLYAHLLLIILCFPKLKKLNLSDNHKFETLPECIKALIHLESLEMNSCLGLQHITAIPPHLQHISAAHCPKLTAESSNLLLNQGLNANHNLSIVVDGGEVPLWFDHRRKEGSLSFLVRRKFPVIALCSVSRAEVRRDIIWLHDLRAHMSPQQWENLDTYLQHDWNNVEVSFTISNGTVKWCGVHAYEQGTKMKDVTFTTPDLHGSTSINSQIKEVRKVIVTEAKIGIVVENKLKAPLLEGAKYAKMWDKEANSDKMNAFKVDGRTTSDRGEADTNNDQENTLWMKTIIFLHGILENVKSFPGMIDGTKKITVWAIASLPIGIESFKANHGMQEGEVLLKTTECDLYTTVGPADGILWISTEKVAFLGFEKDHKPTLTLVVIPIKAIKEANRRENPIVPGQKYMEIVTEDYAKFRFARFFRFENTFKNLLKARSLANVR
ncbi:Disease resistance-like protein [Quillaja saponaria]|uniref:Disease resistance-like protein n=1 Tax=Quillaja saponaria TaxID=32244 RepID=A0AAD7M795_QUISA|nr:Disease resistance-like protein [Quillaja saponaria]